MTAPASKPLEELAFSLAEFARYVGKHATTVRKWFEEDQKCIRIPRGGQRAQILIPISHAVEYSRRLGLPESLIDDMLAKHKRESAPAPAVLVLPAARHRVGKAGANGRGSHKKTKR